MADETGLVPEEAIEAAAAGLVNHYEHLPEDIKEHWRHRARQALPAAAPLILAAELDRMADELDATGVVFHSAAHALRAGKDGVTVQSADLSAEGRGLDRAVAELRLRASVLRGEGDRDG